MPQLSDEAIEEAVHRGDTSSAVELLGLFERHHADGRAGITTDVLAEYAARLEARDDYVFDADEFVAEIEALTTDAERWVEPEAVYAVEADRVSRYPARWHERLADADLQTIVAFLTNEAAGYLDDVSNSGRGVPEHELAQVVSVLWGTDVTEAQAAIEDAQSDDDLLAEQEANRDPEVYLESDEDRGALDN
ncbi:MAG: hypothetical protein ABEJ31_03070 [Haloarculaceae archaeon]